MASGQTMCTSSRAYFEGLPTLGNLTVDIIEPEGSQRVPTLLGLPWLRENAVTLSITTGSATTSSGHRLPVTLRETGHLSIALSIE